MRPEARLPRHIPNASRPNTLALEPTFAFLTRKLWEDLLKT